MPSCKDAEEINEISYPDDNSEKGVHTYPILCIEKFVNCNDTLMNVLIGH